MNKKAQLDYPIITFVILVFGLLLIAPIMLKTFNAIKAPVSSQLGNLTGQGGEIAQTNFNAVMNIAVTFWDKVIVAAFFFAILLLVISAIFIDVNPFFIILYIFISFMLILFAPDIVDSLGTIYDSQTFAAETAALTFMNTIRVHFGEFLVGIMVFTGIIIYGKIALFRNSTNSAGGRR